MRCDTLGPRLSAWVDGELSLLDAWLVARHVASCPTCTAEVNELRALNARLAAANPVMASLVEPVPVRRPVAPLLGAGALVAAGVAGFILMPRPQVSSPSKDIAPTPVVNVAMNTAPPPGPARIESQAPPSADVPMAKPTLKSLPQGRLEGGKAKARSAFRFRSVAEPQRRVSTSYHRRSHHSALTGRVAKESDRYNRELPLPKATKPVQVADVPSSPTRALLAPDEMTFDRRPADLSSQADKDMSAAAKPEMVSPARPGTPPAIVSEGSTDALKKNDMRARVASRAMASKIRPESIIARDADNSMVRKRVVPVLVVTPTRYENAVMVTAGALEVDDTDDKEETQQP
ncbi:MAG: zf-HC2 domain-containing protein [Armatimonas sp.]